MAHLIYTPEMKLSALAGAMRNHRAALKKLSQARTDRDRGYWGKACEHWDIKIEAILGDKASPLPSAKTMIDDLKKNFGFLRKEVDKLIVEDLETRLDALVKTLINDDSQKEIVRNGGLTIER